MRVKIVKRHVAPEMLALSVVELILSFTLALISLTPSASRLDLASVNSAVMCALTVCFVAFVIGLYRPQIFDRARSLVFSTFLSATLSFPAIWLVSKGIGLSSYWPVGYDPFRPLKIVFIWCVGVLGIRLVFLAATRLNFFVHRVAVIGSVDSPSVSAATSAARQGFLAISVVAPERMRPSALSAEGIQTVVFSGTARDSVTPTIYRDLQKHGIKVKTQEEFWESYLRRVDITGGSAGSGYGNIKVSSSSSQIISRMLDVGLSLILLCATLPIMIMVALIVRLDSAGTILYRQERVGVGNSLFTLLKFRSMRSDAEALGPRWAQHRDPRITRVGSFIRRTRIDELPQLLNILRGEMSFVGPRPERPHFVEQLSALIPSYQERSRVKPGLTGWAQVNYPYGASVEDARAKLSYDLYYVRHRSFFLDVLILLSTVRVVLLQDGAR